MELDEKRIYDKLNKIDAKIGKLMVWKATLDERCTAHRGETNEVRKTIYGNPGSADGVQFKVERLWQCKKNLTKFQEFWIYVLKILLITGIVSLVTWLMSIYKGD